MGAEAIGVISAPKISSVGYLQAVFSAWRERVPIVALGTSDGSDLPGTTLVKRAHVSPGGGWFDQQLSLDSGPGPAQISFTSGTTGRPKPILLSRRALSDVTERLVEVSGLDASAREYLGIPVTFSFGLGRARAVASVGGRSFLPVRGFQPNELAGMLANGDVNALSAVPTMLRLLLAQPQLFAACGHRLRWLEIGSQPMSAEEKEAIRRLFPEARIVQHYGLTEASRSTFLDARSASSAMLGSVGRPNGQVEVRCDETGRILIRGPHLADGILTAEGLQPLTDSEGWLRTSDLGKIDDLGFLHFHGRSDNLLNIGGIKVPLEIFEQRLHEQLPEQAGIAVAARPDDLRGEALLVACEPGCDLKVVRGRAAEVAGSFGLSSADLTVVSVQAIPRTETGKIRRSELSETCRSQLPVTPVRSVCQGSISEKLSSILNREIDPTKSYAELGGDSLSFVQVSFVLEDVLGELPTDWETLPIAELDQQARERNIPPSRAGSLDSQVTLRAVAITGVVLNHATTPLLGGGAYLLLALSGALFARFQHSGLSSGRTVVGAIPLLIRIIVVYYLLLITYQLTRGDVDAQYWLLISNFFPTSESKGLAYFWFIAAFVQIVLLYSVLFVIPRYRNWSRRDPWQCGLITMVGCFGLAIFTRSLIEQTVGEHWLAEGHFATRTPMFLLYIFAFGWCLQFTRTKQQRLWMSLAAVFTFPFIGVLQYAIWLIVGSLVALWVPRIPAPGGLRQVLGSVASASFYIFIVHMIPVQLLRSTIPAPRSLILNLLAVLAAILLGLAVSRLFAVAERIGRLYLFRERVGAIDE